MKHLLTLLLGGGVIVGGGWLVYFGPYYMDSYTMQEVTESVALTMASFGTKRGLTELEHQFDKREIDYITAEHCELSDRDGQFSCNCEWQVDVYPPLIGGRRLSFWAGATAGKDQRLVKD
jgi:hypothetical protein